MALNGKERQPGGERSPITIRHHPGLGAPGRGHVGDRVSANHGERQPRAHRRLYDDAWFADGDERTLVTEADWRIATFLCSGTAFIYASIFLGVSGLLK